MLIHLLKMWIYLDLLHERVAKFTGQTRLGEHLQTASGVSVQTNAIPERITGSVLGWRPGHWYNTDPTLGRRPAPASYRG